MDSTRAYLKALVETKKGVNLRTLSRQIKKNDAYLHQYIYRGTPKTLPENLRYHLAMLLGIHESELRETTQDIAILDVLAWLDIDMSAGHGSISDDLAEAGDSWVFDRQFFAANKPCRYICITDAVCEGGFSLYWKMAIWIDMNDTQPSPPGIFVLFDGVGLMTNQLSLSRILPQVRSGLRLQTHIILPISAHMMISGLSGVLSGVAGGWNVRAHHGISRLSQNIVLSIGGFGYVPAPLSRQEQRVITGCYTGSKLCYI